MVMPAPRLITSVEPPALSKVAVSPAPGTGVALQFPGVAQSESTVPFHVAFAASAEQIGRSNTAKRKSKKPQQRLWRRWCGVQETFIRGGGPDRGEYK